jgi:hypothetical protein
MIVVGACTPGRARVAPAAATSSAPGPWRPPWRGTAPRAMPASAAAGLQLGDVTRGASVDALSGADGPPR